MFRKNMALLIPFLFLLCASVAHAATSDSSASSTQGKPDIKVNIQGDTHHVYQGDVQTTGSEMNDRVVQADRKIQTQIVDLVETKFRKYNINIKVSQGNVVLKGTVQNDETKQSIETDVRKISGVKNVDNQLKIQEKK